MYFIFECLAVLLLNCFGVFSMWIISGEDGVSLRLFSFEVCNTWTVFLLESISSGDLTSASSSISLELLSDYRSPSFEATAESTLLIFTLKLLETCSDKVSKFLL